MLLLNVVFVIISCIHVIRTLFNNENGAFTMTYIPSNVGIQKQATSKALDVAGDVYIDSTTASTSSTTGALVIAGGLGIGGDLYIGGAVSFTSATFQNMTVRGITTYNPTTATAKILQSTVSSDTNPRFYIDGNGKHFWGPGGLSTTYDIDLSRTSAGVLSLTGSLNASGNISSSGTGTFNSVSVTTNISVSGTSTVTGNTTCSGIFTGSYANQQTMLKSNVGGSDKFVLDSSGYMTWGGTSLTLSANADSDFNSNPVFSLLNSSGRVMLKNGTASIRSTSANSFSYTGSHTFTNGWTSSANSSLSGNLTVKNTSTSLTSLVINNTGTLDFYDNTGTLLTNLYTDANGLVTDDQFKCYILNATGGVSTPTVSTDTIVVNNATMSIKNPGTGISGCGIALSNSGLPSLSAFMGTNLTGTGFSLKSPNSTSTVEIINPTASSANCTITAAGLTANRTLTIPDSTGTIITDNSSASLSSKIIKDSSLAYTTTTIASGASVVIDPSNYSVVYVTSSSNSSIIGIKVPTFPIVTPSVSSVRSVKIINTSNTAITVVQDSPSALAAERITLTVGLSSISPNGGSMVFTWSSVTGKWYQDGSSANGYSFGRTEGVMYSNFTSMAITLPTGSGSNYSDRDFWNTALTDSEIEQTGMLQGTGFVSTSLQSLQTVTKTFGTLTQTLFVARYNGLYTIDVTAYVLMSRDASIVSSIGLISGDSSFSLSSREYIPVAIMRGGVNNYNHSTGTFNRVNASGQFYLRAGQLFCPYWAWMSAASSSVDLYCGSVTVNSATYRPSYPAIRIFGQEI